MVVAGGEGYSNQNVLFFGMMIAIFDFRIGEKSLKVTAFRAPENLPGSLK